MTRLHWCIFFSLSLLYLLFIYPHRDYLVDDAFISYRYAEHLQEGFEFSYNPKTPQEGYTSFLWVVLLAGFSWFIPIAIVSKALSTFFVLGIFYWFYRASISVFSALALFAIWICLPITWMNGMNGMETVCYTFLLTGQACFALLFYEKPEKKYFWYWGIFALLSGLTRPEGNLFAILLWCFFLFSTPKKKDLIIPTLTFFFLGLLYFGWRIYYFQHPLNQPWPNPFLFKVATGKEIFKVKGITYVRDFCRESYFPILALIAFFQFSQNSSLKRLLFIGIPVICYLLFFLTVEPIVQYFYRFLIPIIPATLLVLLPNQKHPWKDQKLAFVGIICCIILGFGMEWQKNSISGLTQYFSTPLKRTHVPIGKALQFFADKNYVLAASDAGVLPYYSQLRTLDLVGLNHRDFLLNPVTLEKILAPNPTIVVLHYHTRGGKSCGIPAETLLLNENFNLFSKRYLRIGRFYHRSDMDLEVWVLRTCPELKALQEKIHREVKLAQKQYPEVLDKMKKE